MLPLIIGIAFGILGLNILTVLGVGLLRWRLWHRNRNHLAFLNTWRPLLMQQALEGLSTPLPPLHPQDLIAFLNLWNYLHDSLRGNAIEQLNQLAFSLHIPEQAQHMLSRGRMREKLIAIHTLGNLAWRPAWDQLVQMALEDSPVLSFSAFRAMMHISPLAALPLLGDHLREGKANWSRAKLSGTLSKVGNSGQLADALIEEALKSPEPVAAELVRYIGVIHGVGALPKLRILLGLAHSTELQAACLSVLGDLNDFYSLDVIRSYCTHPEWVVRLQAVQALGKVGLDDDIALLTGCLQDSSWWVRYRAALALGNLPGMTSARLLGLRGIIPAPEAEQMIDFVMGRQEIAA
jgi:hypothetical protein